MLTDATPKPPAVKDRQFTWAQTVIKHIINLSPPSQEFQKAFTDEKGPSPKSSPSPGQHPIQREMDETLSIPLAVEQ